MKASELRIGNYIKLMYNYEDYETIQVTSDELVDVDKKRADYEPFPLTEDWLYKFGFKDIDKGDNDYITYTDSEHEYYLQLDVRKRDGKYTILDNSFDDLRDFSMVDISYVHQLQNLYFALTGEELLLNNNIEASNTITNMNKEQIIDVAYENYNKEIIRQREIQKEEVNRLRSQGKRVRVILIELLSKEEFINKCKTDTEFSEKWGLKIEERELTFKERCDIQIKNLDGMYSSKKDIFIRSSIDEIKLIKMNENNIPTKLITITYKDTIIESYE